MSEDVERVAALTLQEAADRWIAAVYARDNKAAWQAGNAMYLSIVHGAAREGREQEAYAAGRLAGYEEGLAYSAPPADTAEKETP